MTIYFNKDKEAHAYEIIDPIATVDSDTWMKYSETERGVGWDIIDGEFTALMDVKTIDEGRESAERERERLSLYLVADNQISKCDNYIDLEIQPDKYSALKRQLLEYKMAVRMTQDDVDYPFEVVYPTLPAIEE